MSTPEPFDREYPYSAVIITALGDKIDVVTPAGTLHPGTIRLDPTRHNAEQTTDLKRRFADTPYRLQVLPLDPAPARERRAQRLECWSWAVIGFALGLAAAALALGHATTPY